MNGYSSMMLLSNDGAGGTRVHCSKSKLDLLLSIVFQGFCRIACKIYENPRKFFRVAASALH
jgi:hypothetical protein